ncbi:retrovirus-related pol polyprotein from transposon TNT 1-94 [Tanacetum coccineum]
MIFNIDSAMKHSYSNDDTCFSIDVIDEILEEDFDVLLDEGSKILHSIEGTLLEEEIFSEFIAMTKDENSESESVTEEPPFEKITVNTDYKIKTSLKEPLTDFELKPLPDNLEYVFLEEPSFLPVIILSQLSAQNKSKLCLTEFKNQILKEYFYSVGISHQASSVRTPQQNGVVESRNQTLVEAVRTMLIFSCAPLFLWAEAIANACYTQNCSIIHRRFNKTPYELINGKKPDISLLHVFGALYYPKNDREDIGKLGAKGDIGFFIGYSADSCAYRVYNQRTKKIIETMNVTFDELSALAFE